MDGIRDGAVTVSSELLYCWVCVWQGSWKLVWCDTILTRGAELSHSPAAQPRARALESAEGRVDGRVVIPPRLFFWLRLRVEVRRARRCSPHSLTVARAPHQVR